MTTIPEYIRTRIQERLDALNLKPRTASMMATGKPDAIRTILKQGVIPSAERLNQIAEVLQTSAIYLIGATDDPTRIDNLQVVDPEDNRRAGSGPVAEHSGREVGSGRYDIDHIRPISSLPTRSDMPKDVPVYGTAIGTSQDIEALENGAIAVEQTSLNTGEVIDYLRRPPGLANSRRAYGLYVAGFSMEPAYEPGTVIIVDPSRPPSVQDYVVVYMRGQDDDDAEGRVSSVMLKRLVRRSSTYVELEQYNPPARFRVDATRVAQMHRVLPLAEIVGV